MEQQASAGQTATNQAGALRSLLDVAVNLSAIQSRRELLAMILREARKLERAEAGSLYVVHGEKLRFVVAQNDRLGDEQISRQLLNKELPLSSDSLVGLAAMTGRVVNVADATAMPPGSPSRGAHTVDTVTGYQTKALLAVPLLCPDGQCIGVLELFNRLGADGRVESFPDGDHDLVCSLASMAAVTIHKARLQQEVKRAHVETIIRLSVAVECRDGETGDHVRRMSHVSAMIAESLGLPAARVELIRSASTMHDIGKIGIPDEILRKTGPLTDGERRTMEKHTLIGGQILDKPTCELVAVARDVALSHHERWDGRGYPRALAGEDIPLCGRIVALADVFDALISKRRYKDAIPLDDTLAILRRDEGKHFDPAVAKAFHAALPRILEAWPVPQ